MILLSNIALILPFPEKASMDTMKANASDMPHANESDYEFVISYMEDNALVDWLSEEILILLLIIWIWIPVIIGQH